VGRGLLRHRRGHHWIKRIIDVTASGVEVPFDPLAAPLRQVWWIQTAWSRIPSLRHEISV